MSFSAHLEGFSNLNDQNESLIMDNVSLIEKNLYIEKDNESSNPLSLTNSSTTIINLPISTQTTNSYFEAVNLG